MGMPSCLAIRNPSLNFSGNPRFSKSTVLCTRGCTPLSEFSWNRPNSRIGSLETSRGLLSSPSRLGWAKLANFTSKMKRKRFVVLLPFVFIYIWNRMNWNLKPRLFPRIIWQITFEILVRVLMSIGPGDEMECIKREFEEFIKGLICIPVNLPGTRLYKSLKV